MSQTQNTDHAETLDYIADTVMGTSVPEAIDSLRSLAREAQEANRERYGMRINPSPNPATGGQGNRCRYCKGMSVPGNHVVRIYCEGESMYQSLHTGCVGLMTWFAEHPDHDVAVRTEEVSR